MSTLTKEYHIIVIFAIIYVKITIEKQKLLCYNKFTEQKKGRANYEKIIENLKDFEHIDIDLKNIGSNKIVNIISDISEIISDRLIEKKEFNLFLSNIGVKYIKDEITKVVTIKL